MDQSIHRTRLIISVSIMNTTRIKCVNQDHLYHVRQTRRRESPRLRRGVIRIIARPVQSMLYRIPGIIVYENTMNIGMVHGLERNQINMSE